MSLSFSGAKCTVILLSKKVFILLPSNHKLVASKLVTYFYEFLDTYGTI